MKKRPFQADSLCCPSGGDVLETLMFMLFTEPQMFTEKLPNRLMPASQGMARDWYAKPCAPTEPKAALWSFEGAVIAATVRCALSDIDNAAEARLYPREVYEHILMWASCFVGTMLVPQSWAERCQVGPEPFSGKEAYDDPIKATKRALWVLKWAHHPTTTADEIRLHLEAHLEHELHNLENELRGG